MRENKVTHEHLRARLNEIRAQLSKLDHEMNAELDRDRDERSIQLEQQEVTLGLVDSLNRDMGEIEKLLLEA